MQTINIDKNVLLELDDDRKTKLRERLASGEISLKVIDNQTNQQTKRNR